MSWADILTALKATRNYGAKVGGVIAGSLGRGQGGRFAKVGSGDAPAPGGKGKRGDVLKAAGVSEAEAKALEDFLAGKPVDEDALAGLYDKGLIDFTSDEKPVANAQGRALAGALKRGDVRKATDAVARGGDRAKKRDAKKAPKAAKPKAGGGGKGKAPKPPKEKPQRDPAKDAEKATRIGDQLDVLDAQVRGSQMNEATRAAAQNRLDKAERDLQELAIDAGEKQAAQGRIDKIRAALDSRIAAGDKPIPINNKPDTARRTTKEDSGFTVFKQADGSYRWIGYSSNAFRDREGEIIPQAVLEADVARADADSNYGPLRIWHIGDYEFSRPLDWSSVKAGPGLDIGTCDFNAMHGRILIESGTFKSAEIAEAIAPHAWQMSIGFSHPLGEPVDGVFNNARRFERSILPEGTAANSYTAFTVIKETTMNKAKETALKALLGDKWDAVAAVLQGAEAIETKALGDGVAFKEDAPAAVAEATTEAKAEGDMPAGDAAAEPEAEDMAESIGDMTVAELLANEEFLNGLMAVMSKSLEPVAAAVEKAVGAQEATATKEASEITALKELVTKAAERIAALEGDMPKGQPGYMASTDTGNVVVKEVKPENVTSELGKLVDSWLGSRK
jgi:hypothetical protein